MSTILILVIVAVIVIRLNRLLPKSSCTGDCNQGRNCDCKYKQP